MLLVLGQNGNLARRFSQSCCQSVDCLPCEPGLLEVILKRKSYKGIVYTGFASHKQPNESLSTQEYSEQALGRLQKCLDVLRSPSLWNGNFIYCSSAAVYGEGYCISEDSPVELQSIYSQVKFQAELLCKDMLNGTPGCLSIARIFNIFGGYDSKSIVSRILTSINDGSVLKVANRGASIRDFIHVDDVKDCLARLAMVDSPPSVINIASGRGVSISELIATATSSSNGKLLIDDNEVVEQSVSIADIKLLKNLCDVSQFDGVLDYMANQAAV